MKPLPLPAGWLTGLSIAAVAAVGLAGFRGITVARQGAHDEAERAFRDETVARARAVETRLTAIRSDLAFLAASSPVGRLGESAGPQEGRRVGAEAALLLFLRGHPEVVRVVVRSSSGEPLVHTGRRGGVPVLWVSSSPTGLEGAAVAPGRVRLTASFSFGGAGEPGTAAPTLETEVDPTSLLAPGEGSEGHACRLRDAAGGLLARHSLARRTLAGERSVRAEAEVAADGWSAPGPWRLLCEQAEGQAVGRVEEVAARYRTTLILNLAAMGLAVVLGAFAVQQARRARAPRGAGPRGGARARARAPALPRRAADHRGPARRRHRPRDQQPARGDGELPEPGRDGRSRGATGEARGTPGDGVKRGPRPRGGRRAPGAGPRRPRQGAPRRRWT